MSENVTKLQYQDKEIILVATAHVSETSVALVKETIDSERPNSVCVELDEGRYKTIEDPEAWKRTDVAQIIRDKKVWLMLTQLILSAYQKRMAKKLGTKVGGEMLQGINSAKEVNAELVLADRNIQTTFLRLWRLLTLREKLKFITGFILGGEEDDDQPLTEEDFQTLLKQDTLEATLGELKHEFPIIGEVLINERDQYLANKIKTAPGPKVLAVLGGAHVPGVIKELSKEQDMQKITTVPAKKSRLKLVTYIIPVLILGLIAYGFLQSVDMGLRALTSWWLWNGGLAALFTLIVLGHPLSILAAFLAAPLTTFAPGLAAGWFAGLAEAWIKKPTVEDMQNIPDDIFRLKGWYQNRFLKVLLVVIAANLGSTIGTFAAGADIMRLILGS
ncbi:MAG: TraB/GumN family protein [Oscillospiraceae bacterium]|nr:TraB/GumN family protein [Oscillospiraceae bacterium]